MCDPYVRAPMSVFHISFDFPFFFFIFTAVVVVVVAAAADATLFYTVNYIIFFSLKYWFLFLFSATPTEKTRVRFTMHVLYVWVVYQWYERDF